MTVIDLQRHPALDWRIVVLVGVGIVAALALWVTRCANGVARCVMGAAPPH